MNIEVGDTLLLGSQRIRATVAYIYTNTHEYIGVQFEGLTYESEPSAMHGVLRANVVEVIPKPKPMPEYQEGDMARVEHGRALRPCALTSPQDRVEIWRETAPGHLERVWEKPT